MKVVVEKAFGQYSVGHVIPEMPGGQARTLIARGLVREIGEDELFQSPVNRMMAADSFRKRKVRG